MNIPTHPCVCQKGSCKFGDKCRFYYIRGDACLFHLRQQKNGGEGCRYGNNCKNRHIDLFDNNDVYYWKERERLVLSNQESERQIKSMEYKPSDTFDYKVRKRIESSNRSDISKEKKKAEKIVKSLKNKERLKELSKKPDNLIVFTGSGPIEINPYNTDPNITKRYQREINEHQKIQGEKERLQRKIDPVKRQQHKEYKTNMDRDNHQDYNGYIPGGRRGCTNCNGGCSCCVDSHPAQNYE